MSKRTGRHSAQQNDFLQPSNVVITSATDVGTGRPYLATANGTAGQGAAVSLVWTLDAGSPPATSYDIVTTPTTVTKTVTTIPTVGSPFVFEGLASGVSYTFTVYAKNNAGSSSGTTSNAITASTVPAAPGTPTVQNYSNDQNDYVSWIAPANGGKSISSYTWESTDSKSGTTASTSVTVAQEANTSQQYRLYATNANGNSDWSPYSGGNTTPPFFPPYFPFFPFFPPYFPFFPFFPYFPYFPFFPFFPHFPPFFPFFPFFPPRFCIEESTLVETPTGLVAAKDLKVGDVLVSVDLNELSTEPREEENFVIAPTLSFADEKLVETTITEIIESEKSEIVYFNGNDKAKYSNEQAMFAKVDGEFQTLNAGLLKVGDILIKVLKDGSYIEEEITEVTNLNEPTIVYQYICEPYNWFIAGGYLVHQN